MANLIHLTQRLDDLILSNDLFPVNKIPSKIKDAILSLQYLSKAPLALCASSIISSINLAVQGHYDVLSEPHKQIEPISMFMIVIAESGERKSYCDKLCRAALGDWQQSLIQDYLNNMKKYNIQLKQYKDKLIKAEKIENPQLLDKELIKLKEPQRPLNPQKTLNIDTTQGLLKRFEDMQPSIGIFTDEGGRIIGSHSMKEENQLHTIAILSTLWDGNTFDKNISSETPKEYNGRRLCMHIMVQPKIAGKLFNNAINQDQGFIARMLWCYPKSTIGTRFWIDDEIAIATHRGVIKEFNDDLLRWYNKPYNTDPDDNRHLTPDVIRYTKDARKMVIEWDAQIEEVSIENGLFHPIRAFASKRCSHLSRMAATFAAFQNKDVIDVDTLLQAIAVIDYYFIEALTIGENLPNKSQTDTELEEFQNWLMNWKYDHINYRTIVSFAPKKFRRFQEIRTWLDISAQVGILTKEEEDKTFDVGPQRRGKNTFRINKKD